MLFATFQKAINYIKKTQDIVLFSTMADTRWYWPFGISPLFYIMLPFMGLLLTIKALSNAYLLIKTKNKNFDQWLGFTISVVCAVLGGISLFGAAISAVLSISFAAGPWFFFSSLVVAGVHQLTMLALNLRRAYESAAESRQRMHHLQAALNHLFMVGLLSAAMSSILFIMLIPSVAPLLGFALAITAVALMLMDIAWQIIPHNWKLTVKNIMHLDKPAVVQNCVAKPEQAYLSEPEPKAEQNPQHYHLFTRPDYSAKIRAMDVESAQNYLHQLIVKKINSYGVNETTHDQKTRDKLGLLNQLRQKQGISISEKNLLLKTYPLAFQNFWAEKGDVEQIVNAAVTFNKKCKQASFNEEQTRATCR